MVTTIVQTPNGNQTVQEISDIDRLRNMRLPEHVESTRTFKPLGHGDAFKKLEVGLHRNGLEIDVDHPDAVSLTTSGPKAEPDSEAFAAIRLRSIVAPGIKFMVGMINSFNKSRSFQLGFGSIVVVCQNNHIFSTEALRKKHTTHNMDKIDEMIDETLGRFNFYKQEQGNFFTRLQEIELSQRDAKALIFDSQLDGTIVGNEPEAVYKQWKNPRFEEFAKDNSAYRLLNAFTDVFKRGIENEDGTVAKQGILSRNGGTFVDRSVALAHRFNQTLDLGVNQNPKWN